MIFHIVVIFTFESSTTTVATANCSMGGLTTTDGAAMSRKRKAESNKLLATLSSKKVKVAQAGDERDHPKSELCRKVIMSLSLMTR